MITVRKADESDIKEIFDNSNEDIVRQFSIHNEKVEWENHKAWYKEILNDKSVLYFVIYEETLFIGQVRFKINDNDNMTVSISLSKNGRGKGYSKTILDTTTKLALMDKKEIKSITAYIISENVRSIELFEKSGYIYEGRGDNNGKTVMKYTKRVG